MSQTSGTAQPVIRGPAAVSVIARAPTPILGITVTDTNQPHAGTCSLSVTCNNGTLTMAGASGSGTAGVIVQNTFLNCQIALTNVVYTGPLIGSDVITVLLWNQLGNHSSLKIPVTIIAATTSPPQNLAVSAKDSSTITVKWDPPAPSGLSITYQLQLRVHGDAPWTIAATPPSQTAIGLLANTAYDLRVVASNGINSIASSVITAATLGLGTPSGTTSGDATGAKAFRIADMLERFGVNTFSSPDPTTNAWGSYPADYSTASVIAGLKWLTGDSGLTIQVREYHYVGRESWQASWCPTVANATGARFSMAIGAGGSTADVSTMMKMAGDSSNGPGWLSWVENINEPNTDFGSGTVSADETVALQQRINAAASALASAPHPVTVVGPSIVFGLPTPEGYITPSYASSQQMAQINSASAMANAHLYPPSQIDADDGSARGGCLNDVVIGLSNVYSGKPLIVTEWHPTLYNGQGHSLDSAYDAYYAPCFFLSAFRSNLKAWFWYALLDYGTTFHSGLFPKTGAISPRPVAQTIRAMFTLTGDTSTTKRSFVTGNLNYAVTGLPPANMGAPNSGGQTMLFQNSSGRFFLFIWNSQISPEGPSVPVTVHFASHLKKVADYKISDVARPTTAVQILTDTTSITVQLNASVHLLVIDY